MEKLKANNNTLPKRKRMRLPNCSYLGGCFFVTICCQGRVHRFGEIEDGEMLLNDVGNIVCDCLNEIGHAYEDYSIEDYIVMPDHVHFIARIDATSFRNLSSVVRLFKSVASRRISIYCSEHGYEKHTLWQRGFYDTIIRTNEQLEEIRIYMFDNPIRWRDKEEE